MITQIDHALLEQTFVGVNLAPGPLRQQLGNQPTLLVFLRHFGCLFCREAVQDVREAVAAHPDDYPPVIFVYMGQATDGASFFASAWPEARAIADPERKLYRAFGVERAGWSQVISPGVIACGLRASTKGHVQGKNAGDPWQMPGAFLVEGDRVLWRHDYAHVGDRPDWNAMPSLAQNLSAGQSSKVAAPMSLRNIAVGAG